ncbi:M14 family metallopeptidase [candidate division KSB1 bacterium]
MKRTIALISVLVSCCFLTSFVIQTDHEPAQTEDSNAGSTLSVQQRDFEFRYHNYAESTAILRDLARAYPRLAKLYSIGKSVTGTKELWCIEISNTETGPAEEKPAAYFDGNHHSSEVVGGEVTLYLAHYLLTNYRSDPEIRQLLDTRVVYIVHRGDPDGAEAYITGKADWDAASVPGASDRDNDGRKGEDGTDDIDGDGEILRMRIEDPNGQWKPHPDDARYMIRRERGDTAGPFYRVIDEGIDNDGDGRLNEDPPITGFISNRNYPAFWSSVDGRYRGQGDYPLQEHNARLICDFILSKPNISQVESYHTTSGIHLRPYAALPDDEFPPQDLHDYSAILAKGNEITTYPAASVYNDFTTIDPNLPWDKQPGVRHGVFIDWTYVHLGLFSVTTELWTMEPIVNEVGWGDIPRDKPLFAIQGRYNREDVQLRILQWLDLHKDDPALSGQGFTDWKPFRHPALGEVEIGGFTKYWLRNPPPGPHFEKLVTDQVKFAIVRALLTPIVGIKEVNIVPEGRNRGVWNVTVTAANDGYLDTSMEQARNARIARPDRLTIELPDNAATDDPRSVSFPFMRGTRGSDFVSNYSASWRIQAQQGTKIKIVLVSEKGGTVRREITLSR